MSRRSCLIPYRSIAIDPRYHAVRLDRVADLQRLQQVHAVCVLVTGNGELGRESLPHRISGDHGCSAPPETSSSTHLPFLNFLHIGFETGPVPVPTDKAVSGMRAVLTPLTAATYKRLSFLSWRSGRKERRAASIGFVFHLVVPPTKTAASNDRHRLHTLFHCLRLLRRFRQ